MLPHLTELSVEHNRLERLPAVLWSAPRLARVSLRANRLTAASLNMPPEASAPIQALDLGENRLGSVPPLASLTNLNELHMQARPPPPPTHERCVVNSARGPPCAHLPLDVPTAVAAQGNGIASLPVEALPLRSLTTLDIRDNDLTNLPPQLSLASALQALSLSGNPLRSVPISVQQKGAGAVLALLARRMPEQ
jgi:Leucine-rich repeat (LRR) protein